jgi:hypothetical protein
MAHACTFIITNDSPYQKIFLVGDTKVPEKVSEEQLEACGAIKIEKGKKGQLHKIIYIYTPVENEKDLYQRHIFITTRYCGQTEEENTLRVKYSQIVKRKFSKNPKTQEELTRRIEVIDKLHGEKEPEHLLTREHN